MTCQYLWNERSDWGKCHLTSSLCKVNIFLGFPAGLGKWAHAMSQLGEGGGRDSLLNSVKSSLDSSVSAFICRHSVIVRFKEAQLEYYFLMKIWWICAVCHSQKQTLGRKWTMWHFQATRDCEFHPFHLWRWYFRHVSYKCKSYQRVACQQDLEWLFSLKSNPKNWSFPNIQLFCYANLYNNLIYEKLKI